MYGLYLLFYFLKSTFYMLLVLLSYFLTLWWLRISYELQCSFFVFVFVFFFLYFVFLFFVFSLIEQNLVTKLVVAYDYNFTQYLFIECEFWQIHHWIISSSYIFYACKISKKLNINSYVINKLFKLQVFVI